MLAKEIKSPHHKVAVMNAAIKTAVDRNTFNAIDMLEIEVVCFLRKNAEVGNQINISQVRNIFSHMKRKFS